MKTVFNNLKDFHATIAYTCRVYQESNALTKDRQPFGPNSGVSEGNYIWAEFDDPKKFYAVIQKVAEFLNTLFGSLHENSFIVECNEYVYNLTDYNTYRNFLYDFEFDLWKCK